jgi:putative serine/threonine-protein kinase pknA2
LQDSNVASAQNSGVAPAKSRKRIVVATALLLIVAIIATAWYFMAGPGQRVDVPKVAGKSYKEAVAALSSKGLSAAKKESYSDSVPSGRVLSTDPAAGTSIHPSTKVTVTVSAGVEKVEVPDLSGKTEAQAKEALRKARLSYEVTTQYSESVKKGRVIAQSSKAGAWVEHDSAVKITVSGGREPIDVPKVVGMWKNDAVSKLENAGFTVSIEEESSDSVAKDAVISQDPEEGESGHRHDNVTIKVSTGNNLVDVPNVLGKSTDDAESELKSAGFSVKKHRFFGALYDTVNRQTPRSGKKAPRGSTVTIGTL